METNKNPESDQVQKGSQNALKKIDIIANGEFVANGKTYFLEPQISIERFKKMNEFEIELSFATTFKKHYASLRELKDIMNQARFVDGAVKLNNIMVGMHRVLDNTNHHPILKYCALILNTDDEDRKAYDEKVMNDKIKDWQEEGVPIESFFSVALHTVNGLHPSLKDVFHNTSETNQK